MITGMQAYYLMKLVEGVPLRVETWDGREYPELDPYMEYGIMSKFHRGTFKALRDRGYIKASQTYDFYTHYAITDAGRSALNDYRAIHPAK